jgi:hypothetical protein
LAINLRCHANSVSGVTIVATSFSSFRPIFFALAASPPTLVIAETHSAASDLLSQNPILLHQIMDDMLVMLVHPTGQRDDENGKRVQERTHCRKLSRALSGLAPSIFNQSSFAHYDINH